MRKRILQISESEIRKIVREEIGRNYHTLDTRPNAWDTFQDFEISYYPQDNGSCLLDITYLGKPIVTSASFGSQMDAQHHARIVIDDYRVKVMNSTKNRVQ